jgi:DNA-binding MarR family transcriptional regulator
MDLKFEQFQGLAGFRYALRQFIAASEVINREAGLTQPQYQALLVLKTHRGGPLSIGAFAEQLLLTHHAAVQMADRLAKAGLAERTRSAEDRRTVHLALTEKGEALLDVLAARHLQEVLRQEPLLTRSLARLKGMAQGG